MRLAQGLYVAVYQDVRDLVNVLLVFASTVSPATVENASIHVGRRECVWFVE